jgi:hypothetical protein
MATPEHLEPSRRLSQAAMAERERLAMRLQKLDARASALSEQLRQLNFEREDLIKRMALLDQLRPSDSGPHLRRVDDHEHSVPGPRGSLRGAAIRQTAVEVLATRGRPTEPIHYTRWLELVQEAGYGIAGRDPAATFLTQIGRAALVVRADRPGEYMLDLEAPLRLRERLNELHEELFALHSGQQTLEAVVSTRERRDELLAEIGRSERALEEALATLGNSGLTGAD